MGNKSTKKKVLIVFLAVIVIIALGFLCTKVFVFTGNGIMTIKSYEASCNNVFSFLDSDPIGKESAILKGMKKGEKKYIGTDVKLDNMVVYRMIDGKNFVTSSSGFVCSFTPSYTKKRYLTLMDEEGSDRFVITGNALKMNKLNEPGPNENLQVCDIYGVYEGLKTIKDTNGKNATLPQIKVVILVGNQ